METKFWWLKQKPIEGWFKEGVSSVGKGEVVFPAAASGPGGLFCFFVGLSQAGVLAVACDRASGGTVQAVPFKSPSRGRVWGQVGGDRGAEGPGLGAPLPGSERPPSLPLSQS